MGRMKGQPQARRSTEWRNVPPEWTRLADDRTRNIVRDAVAFYGAAGIAAAVTSAYLQGCEDMATAIEDRRPRLLAMEVEGGAGI